MPRTKTAFEPPIYTFRVRILESFYAPPEARKIWREIEVAANQTLSDLGYAIPDAFDFDDPHRWSFFLSGRAWDDATEYALASERGPFQEGEARLARKVRIRDVPYPGTDGKKEFLFLFDYGDEWHFGVKLVRIADTLEPKAQYPRIVASQGASPPQYPGIDEDEEDEDEDDAEDE